MCDASRFTTYGKVPWRMPLAALCYTCAATHTLMRNVV